ncbi:MAG: ABC transporter ATP-binding protein [Chloroflexi bacterium]|jgi:ABC-2 type transport system ATP-binding protein|nr:ABC transporter ATP-binding protein [Chloroflexota bacterium]
MSIPAIVSDNLTYWYGDLLAVDHISFEVAEGEVLGFLGPNGAGKSTAVKMLTGQLLPKEGRAQLLGKDVARHAKELHAHIGVCFELSNLYETMTAADNLRLFARLFGVANIDADALLDRVGLGGYGRGDIGGADQGH